MSEDFILAHRLGITIIRPGIGWDDTNPRPGDFDWRFWRAMINRAAAARIAVRPYYAYTPAWAGPAYNSPPRRDSDFAAACGRMAREITPLAPSLEIWNEPDNAAFWSGGAPAYGRLIDACAQAIRAERLGEPIVLGGLVYLDSAWLQRSGARAPAQYDIASFHQYTETPWNPTTVEKITSPADYFGGYDRLSQHAATPVWMDEGGASTDAAQGYSEVTQASWIRRTVASLLGQAGRPLALFGLYQLRDPDPKFAKPIGDPVARRFFMHTGLFTLNGRAKLGAATYADLVGLFSGHRPAVQDGVSYRPATGRVSREFRLYAWRLEQGRQVVMIWDRKARSSGEIELPIAGATAFLHGADGSVTKLRGFNGHRLPVPDLTAGGMPMLFEVR